MLLYFAYGSNLNPHRMKARCPSAVAVSPMILPDWQLVFRSVADICPAPGSKASGGVWLISDADADALDAYEGVASGVYRREYIPIKPFKFRGEVHEELLTYVMLSTGIMPPTSTYLAIIRDGYRFFKLKQGPLDAAVEASHDDKAPSHIERQRHRRAGRPALAQRPSAKGKPPTAKRAKHGPARRRSPTEFSREQLSLWTRAMTVHGD